MRYPFFETEAVSSRFVSAGRMDCLIYENRDPSLRKSVGVVVIHSDSNYLNFSADIEFASRGYSVLAANPEGDGDLGQRLSAVSDCIRTLKQQTGVDKVVLFGHSGGATLMTCYQATAENGREFFQDKCLISPMTDGGHGGHGGHSDHGGHEDRGGRNEHQGHGHRGGCGDLEPADGVMLIDANWGNGAMMLFSLDPAVVEEGNGLLRDPELDIFNPANGFDPAGSHYSEEFKQKFFAAQGARNNRLIAAALERKALIEKGKGNYNDDEPFLVTGGAPGFMNNKLYAQDISLLSRTRQPHPLLRSDGSVTTEIIQTLRPPQNPRCFTGSYREGLLITTVNTFLSSHCVRTTADYGYDADTVRGVDWESSYCNTTGNVRGIHAPLLAMGMTGNWEFACAETVYENAASEDKTLAYVEGAGHMFNAVDAKYGDTLKTVYDYAAAWLSQAGRF